MDDENTKNNQSASDGASLSAPAGSLLMYTEAEIRQLRSARDPILDWAADELEEAANYSFSQNKLLGHSR